MFLLGLLLPICYIPGYTGAAIPTQWALVGVALLPSLWHGRMTAYHWLGSIFLAYACASQFWSLDYGYGVWLAVLWALAFWWGGTQSSLLPLWQGLAWGLALNVPIALAQSYGWQGIPSMYGGAAGLLFNSTLLGACCALVLAALISHHEWRFTPILGYALWLSHSRGAWLALALALIAKHAHPLVALALLICGALWLGYAPGPHDVQRLQIWATVIGKLSAFGWGAGSLAELYMFPDPHLASQIIHVEFAHNDILQLIFEYGLGAISVFILFAFALAFPSARNYAPLVGFAVLATFWFPLFAPIPAFIGCACAGHILRRHDPVIALRRDWGPDLVPGDADPEPCSRAAWSEALPSLARIAH
jgi:hypothetical protein